MYHHFSGKEELARIAIDRTAEDMRAKVDALLSGPGTALERIAAYLRRERDVLKGCPIGRLTQDPDVMDAPLLRGAGRRDAHLAARASGGPGGRGRRRRRAEPGPGSGGHGGRASSPRSRADTSWPAPTTTPEPSSRR